MDNYRLQRDEDVHVNKDWYGYGLRHATNAGRFTSGKACELRRVASTARTLHPEACVLSEWRRAVGKRSCLAARASFRAHRATSSSSITFTLRSLAFIAGSECGRNS